MRVLFKSWKNYCCFIALLFSGWANAGCEAPYPTTPGEPNSSLTITDSTGSAKITLWYESCGNSQYYIMARVELIDGGPYICGQSTVIQNGVQNNNVYLLDSQSNTFCGVVFTDMTLAVGTGGQPFESIYDFTYIFQDASQQATLPAYTGTSITSGLAECEASYNPATDKLTIPCLDVREYGKYTVELTGPFNVNEITAK